MRGLIAYFLIAFLLAGCRSSILDDPAVILNYSLPERAHVTLTVENSYNTTIAVLVDADQDPGNYTVPFSLPNLLEGVYFYTLECKGINSNYYFKSTKNVITIK